MLLKIKQIRKHEYFSPWIPIARTTYQQVDREIKAGSKNLQLVTRSVREYSRLWNAYFELKYLAVG